MFYSCNLNAPSVKNIALTINKAVTNNPRIDLGIDSTITSDAQVKKDLGLIKYKGWDMYVNNSNATTYTLPKYAGCTTYDEIKAKDANYLTNDIVNGEWTEHLPDLLEDINKDWNDGMFYACSALTAFNADMSSLTNGDTMFRGCSNLTTFNANLSSLTDGSSMFYGCNALTAFTSDLPNLTNGYCMFNCCSNLNSFYGDLSSLTNGMYMFERCSKLTSFYGDLSSLANGEGMFRDCQLSLPSV